MMNVSDRDVKEAIDYLVDQGFIDELNGDMAYYVQVVLARAAESVNEYLDF